MFPSGAWLGRWEDKVLGDKDVGLSVMLAEGRLEEVECAAVGKFIVPVVEIGEVDELEPLWLVAGGKRPPGDRLTAIGG